MPTSIINIEEQLDERAKELHCLFRISEVVDYFDDDIEKILEAVIEIVPESMKYPPWAEASIQVSNGEWRTPGWKSTDWCYSAAIRSKAAVIGHLSVAYTRELPEEDQGPFLKEEVLLINAIAERVGKVVSRIEAQKTLATRAESAKNINLVLKEVLQQAEEEKRQVEGRIQQNINSAILPLLDRMEILAHNCQHKPLLLLLRSNLEDIAGEFVTRVESAAGTLSLREHQICDMIRLGMSSKEIAESLNLSTSTVHNHRERIRNKLGLQNTRTNLASFLQSL
jgi:DNA-binding CsgD family transcriptional regulator